jgi:hypothetical protein
MPSGGFFTSEQSAQTKKAAAAAIALSLTVPFVSPPSSTYTTVFAGSDSSPVIVSSAVLYDQTLAPPKYTAPGAPAAGVIPPPLFDTMAA